MVRRTAETCQRRMARVQRTLETIVRVVCLIALGGCRGVGAATRTADRRRSGHHRQRVTRCHGDRHRRGPDRSSNRDHRRARRIRGRCASRRPLSRHRGVRRIRAVERPRSKWERPAATLDSCLRVSSLAESVTVTATKTGAADVQSTPVAITVLPATDPRAAGGADGRRPRGRRADGHDLAAHRAGAGDHPRHRHEHHVSAPIQVPLFTSTASISARPAMVFADFLNVERVEVLRGPQGTLYGRNSVGGTINIVTRQPTNTLETSVRLTAGNYDKLRAEGAVSGPLIKNKVMGNFAFLRGTREGFVKRSRSSRPLARQRRHVGRTRAAAYRPRDAQRVAAVGRPWSI